MAIAVALCALVGANPAGAQVGEVYVALGDSYTSGPLVPMQHGDPIDCGSLDDPVTGAAGGLLAGLVIGAGQWLALRTHGIGRRWVAYTAAAMAAGTALSAALTGAGTDLTDVMVTGLVTGAMVGGAQSSVLGKGAKAAAWTAVTAAGWSLGWLATWAIIVDIERGYYVFGAGGAVVVTVLTGMMMRSLLGSRELLARFG